MTTQALPSSTNICPCIPDTPGKTAAAALAIILIAATVLATLILLRNDPSLNTIFYPVYGVIAGFGIIVFVIAAINMCKKPPQPIVIPTPSQTQPGSAISSNPSPVYSQYPTYSPLPGYAPMPQFVYPPQPQLMPIGTRVISYQPGV